VGDAHEPPEHFTVVYESAVVFGTAEEVRQDEEKIRALRLLCRRHTPANMAAFDAALDREYGAAAVWKIHIDEISGKQRLPPEPHGGPGRIHTKGQ
jgi:nitroimidazol reductase NimA-like FMN-containing flavoprotein (pyridoxamine 5'-phosphate oxidase superfamily)